MPHLVLLALCLAALPAAAQSPAGEGLTLGARAFGVGLGYDPVGPDDNVTDSGGGLGVQVGYGVSRSVTLFLTLEGAAMEPDGGGDGYGLGVADLGARFHLTPSARLVPYLSAALTAQNAAFDVPNTDDDLNASGGGLTLGAGILYGLSRSVALDVGLQATGARFSRLEFAGNSTENFDDIEAAIVRLGIGIVARP